MPKIDIDALEIRSGCSYPDPFREICLGATWRKLGEAAGGRTLLSPPRRDAVSGGLIGPSRYPRHPRP